ncbi:MAG: GNAT family protein, partial [Boseongicola sp.]|nr:GNAT family protein [Boseongicola sp.]
EPVRPGLSVEGSEKWFEEIQEKQENSQIYLGIFDDEGNIVGDIQLSGIDWMNRTASLGAGIARSKDRGKGYCTDAARVMLRFGFEHLDLQRISAATISNNAGAIRVLEKLGFSEEGREREAVYWSNQRWDRLMYGILKSEFEAIQS